MIARARKLTTKLTDCFCRSDVRNKRRLWAELGLAIVLTVGCARFEPRSISPEQTAQSLDARSLDDFHLREFLDKNQRSPKTTQWSFEELYLVALYYHPSLDLARAQWQTALGGDAVAAGRPNPTIGLVPGYNFSATSPLTPWLPAVTFDLPIETAGKRGYRQAQAHSLSESARLNIAATAWHVRSGLRIGLIDFTTSSQRVEVLRRQASIQEKIITSLEQRLQAGAISSSEITPVRIALSKTRVDLLDAHQLQVDARVRVADAMGVSVSALSGTDLRYDLVSTTSFSAEMLSLETRRQALHGRSDVLSALADYAASQSALQFEIARQYPDIHLGPGYQFDQGDHKFTLSLNAELPIFNQNQGPIALAKAKRAEAGARFVALQAKVITEIDRAAASYRVALENLSVLESLGNAQKLQLTRVNEQVQAGVAEQLDLLNSQVELAASDLLQLAGWVKLQQSAGALDDAVQRPFALVATSLVEQSSRPSATSPQ